MNDVIIDATEQGTAVRLKSDVEREAYAIRVNVNRRNLSPDQKSEIAKRQKALAAVLRGTADAPVRSQEQIAAMLGVARETVRDWLSVSIGVPAEANVPPPKRKRSTQKLDRDDKAEIFERVESRNSERTFFGSVTSCVREVTEGHGLPAFASPSSSPIRASMRASLLLAAFHELSRSAPLPFSIDTLKSENPRRSRGFSDRGAEIRTRGL